MSKPASVENAAKRRDTHDLHFDYTQIDSPAPLRASPARRPEWAVIVTHGMGQQLHFETLEQLVLALRDAELRAHGDAAPVKTRIVKLPASGNGSNGQPGAEIDLTEAQVRPDSAGLYEARITKLPAPDGNKKELLRAEMTVVDKNRQPHNVDLYESYWAPLTEGKVTLWDSLKFMLEGFWRGILFLLRYGPRFDRWVFGGMKDFHIREFLTTLRLAIALLIFLVPVLLATLVTAAQIGGALLTMFDIASVSQAGKDIVSRLLPLTPDLAAYEILVLVYAFGVGLLPLIYRRKFFAGRAGLWRRVRKSLEFAAIGISILSLLAVFFTECWAVIHWKSYLQPNAVVFSPLARLLGLPQFFRLEGNFSYSWRIGVVWAVALIIAAVVRWFLIEYMGDVAAYLSAHKLSKFDELRDSIQKAVFDVMAAVYTAPGNGDCPFLYDKLIIVGHSLGSVISYDVLNRMLVEDELAAASDGNKAQGLHVKDRTKLLLTFGSPLDKTAFLFRTKGNTDELREAAAANWQPLIRKYAFRPESWVNIYSAMDIVSGNLHFYDDPDDPSSGGTKRIDNMFDWEALLPIAAHVQYWTNRKFGDTLYAEIH